MGRHSQCSTSGQVQSEEPQDSPSVVPHAHHTQWALGLVPGLTYMVGLILRAWSLPPNTHTHTHTHTHIYFKLTMSSPLGMAIHVRGLDLCRVES